MKKAGVLTIVFVFIAFCYGFSYGQEGESPVQGLKVFYSQSCHKCLNINHKIIPAIESEFKGRITVDYLDISDIQNYKLLLSLKEKYGIKHDTPVPVLYLQGHFLSGDINKEGLRQFILNALKGHADRNETKVAPIDPVAKFRNIEAMAVVSAGLVDGINPCAFTVIVFFVSFLALQGYRKRELLLIGLLFIFAVFLTYILIGVGIFGFLYRLRSFWMVSRVVNISVGVLSIALGFAALYDYFKFKKDKSPEGLILKLPQAIKNRIHTLIGSHYRKGHKNEAGRERKGIFGLMIASLTTGFLVSLLESVCTGQVYLPTIVFVLKATPLKIQALGYLLLYNLMFIAPLVIIFILAMLGVTSLEFSRLLKRHLSKVKIAMAFLFFGLGVFLLWKT
ncbi:MAG: hypothetical protein WC510_06940 [Candidatus Omnitrophota bacterium]